MTVQLELKNIWQAPGYRELSLTLIDPETKKEYRVHFSPRDLQHLINQCADAAKQIGTEGPIDWDRYPTQIYWPTVAPWRAGPRVKRGGPTVDDPNRPYCKPDQSCCDFTCGN